MRAVHAYAKIDSHPGCAYFHDFDLIVWKLSVARNKRLGFTTVLYATERDRAALEKVGIVQLYDEVIYVNDERFARINQKYFWAAFKFVAIEHEIEREGEFFVVDTDLVFMDDSIVEFLSNHPTVFWQDEEPLLRYPNPATLHVPNGFRYPDYFSASIRPINTAIIKVDNKEALREWLSIAWSFMLDNTCDDGIVPSPNYTGYMVTVEQRFLPIVLRRKYHLTPDFFSTKLNQNFSKSHFHIWGQKYPIAASQQIRDRWIKTILEIIRLYEPDLYSEVVNAASSEIQSVRERSDDIWFEPTMYKYIEVMAEQTDLPDATGG